jgi:hypothetical protein
MKYIEVIFEDKHGLEFSVRVAVAPEIEPIKIVSSEIVETSPESWTAEEVLRQEG